MGPRVQPGATIQHSHDVQVRLSGIGRERAQRAARALVDAGAGALVSWGSAGGLAPGIGAGDLVLPDAVVGADARLFEVEAGWCRRARERLDGTVTPVAGRLAEALKVLARPEDKAALHAQTGAVAVDMESAAVAEVAEECGIAFLAVRAVSDDARATLSPVILSAVHPSGRLDLWRLLKGVLRRPGEVTRLWRHARDFGATRRTLAAVADTLGPTLAYR